MAPLAIKLKKEKNFKTEICLTAQHREMLDQVMETFRIQANYDLDIMKRGQTLADITCEVVVGVQNVIDACNPDIVLVHGDTTTSMAAAIAAFYKKIKIGHVEAGLRTYNKYSPYPEEMNRQIVDQLADLFFAPTIESKYNLINEGKDEANIFVTGNTVIDAMKYTIYEDFSDDVIKWVGESKMILITTHRRENIGEPMYNIFEAVNKLTVKYRDIKFVFPVHLNPQVRKIAKEVIGNNNKVRLIDPLDVEKFHNYMKKAYLIMTDSGGIQEEAPSLGIPVLVLRDTTERPEGLETGTLKLVGTRKENIYNSVSKLLDDRKEYDKMSQAHNPYGDGKACDRIIEAIKKNI